MIWCMWVLIGIGSLILWGINYMIMSKAMGIDYDGGPDTAFCLFFAFIGSVILIPIFFLVIGTKPILRKLDTLRDVAAKKIREFERWSKKSRSEKKESRDKKEKEKRVIEDAKKSNIIKALGQEIRTLNARIDELNKYKREDIIEV